MQHTPSFLEPAALPPSSENAEFFATIFILSLASEYSDGLSRRKVVTKHRDSPCRDHLSPFGAAWSDLPSPWLRGESQAPSTLSNVVRMRSSMTAPADC